MSAHSNSTNVHKNEQLLKLLHSIGQLCASSLIMNKLFISSKYWNNQFLSVVIVCGCDSLTQQIVPLGQNSMRFILIALIISLNEKLSDFVHPF